MMIETVLEHRHRPPQMRDGVVAERTQRDVAGVQGFEPARQGPGMAPPITFERRQSLDPAAGRVWGALSVPSTAPSRPLNNAVTYYPAED